MMHCTADYLFVPPFMPYPAPDISYNAPTNRLSQSLLHLHVVGSTPQFTSISVGGSPIISNYLLNVRPQKPTDSQISGSKSLIKLLRGLRLSEEQLVSNSFPRWKNGDRTKAVVVPSFFDTINGRKEFIPDEDTRRRCVRCHAPYRLPSDGRKRVDFCIHHAEPAVFSSEVKTHPCCGRALGVAGCQHAESHVTDTMRESVLSEFHATPEPAGPSDPRTDAFYALDCEFVYTTWGKEAARVTMVDEYGNEVVDCVFQPEHELVDPNTRYSGLTTADIENSETTLSDVREILFEMINSETILIGHALENDLKALRIVHDNVIDTSVLFSRSSAEGRRFKRSLKSLAREKLDMEIQSEAGGHDSGEDAWAAMRLVLRAVKSAMP
ncbi:exonuclease [Ancylostoma caninum]|uniref:Exonuclease n=1 Tax=Ancylostoma caninum TaxID=29170 RepID=A0A368H7A2_ANCCA|nr:exonuclease [Ancylostoma caninum]